MSRLERKISRLGKKRWDNVESILKGQRKAFRKKFGRDPGPDDPVFFDPDSDVPAPVSVSQMREETARAMASAGIRGELIYAYLKTGLLVAQENVDLFDEGQLAEWQDAIDEYLSLPMNG